MANTKATPKYKSHKGKRHPAHAVSFTNVAEQLRKHANNPQVDLSTPRAMLRVVADVLDEEGKRVQAIVR